jgi:hypothetical protein
VPDKKNNNGNKDKVSQPTTEKRGGYTGGQPRASVKPPVKVPSQSVKPSAAQTQGSAGSSQSQGPAGSSESSAGSNRE